MVRSSLVSPNLATSDFYVRVTEEDARVIFDSFKRIEDTMVCMRDLGIEILPAVLHGRMVLEALEAYRDYCLGKIEVVRAEAE